MVQGAQASSNSPALASPLEAGDLQGTRWKPLPSAHLVTSLSFADPGAEIEVDPCPSTSPTDQGLGGGPAHPGTRSQDRIL